jgi:TonB family protein
VEAATNEPASAHAAASAFANPAAVVPTRLRFGFSLNKKYRLALAALAAATAAFILGIVISSGSSEINATPSAAVAGPAGGSQMSTPTNHPRVAVPAKSHIDTSHWTQATKLAALNGNSAKPTKDAAPKLRQPPRPENYTPGVIVTSVTPAASTPSVEATSPISGDLIPGAVSRRALPRVPTSASNTIWGTVRVSVIVDVDPRGRVVEAKLDTPGPSRYFASLSMAAAQDWKFTPPRVEGNVVPSEWLINFGYSKTDVSAAATEKHP